MKAATEIAVRVLAGSTAGPRLLVLAGVHGDEYEPMEAVRRLATRLASLPFRGSVALVPVANPTAFAAATRIGSDGLDMARSFPGDPLGSPTQRAAHAVTCELELADCLVDLHTGGRAMRALPMVGYTLHPDPRILDIQRRLARSFGLPVIWGTSPALEGRSLSAARDRGVPAIYAEHGGGGGDPRLRARLPRRDARIGNDRGRSGRGGAGCRRSRRRGFTARLRPPAGQPPRPGRRFLPAAGFPG
jgi:predicted deacylase